MKATALTTDLDILLVLAAFILVLIFIHRRQRTARYQELQDYYHEQMRFVYALGRLTQVFIIASPF